MVLRAGQVVPKTGQYRCEGCPVVFRFEKGQTFPPCPCGGDLYRGVDADETGERQESPNMATGILIEEHEVVLMALKAVDPQGGPRSASGAARLLDFLRVFVDRCHHAKEEQYLFPAVQRLGSPEASNLVDVLLEEHEMARTQIRAAQAALADAQAGSAQALVTLNRALSVYVEIIHPHIVRENDVLFPMVDRLLDERDQHELVVAFARIEAESLGPGVHERYHQLAHELAAGRTQSGGGS